MQIEVTDSEAMQIYSQRHWKSKGKKKYLPLIILAMAFSVSIFIYSPGREWLSLAILIFLTSPAVYLSLKSARASGKYARNQIEGQI